MSSHICYNCFKDRGEYEVCMHCGHIAGAPSPYSDILVPGTILDGKYLIGTTIGRGGFGIIYKAYDMVLNKIVAIKEHYPARLVNRGIGETKVGICSGERKEEYNKRLERFMSEARNMASFSEENDIVNVYRFFQANGTAYIIMEYVDGILLKDYLEKNGKMETGEAVGYTIAVLKALEKLHKKKVIHRDISPDNIFLMGQDENTGDYRIKLIDFGAAAFLDEEKQDEELEPIIKPGYAPPEQYASNYTIEPYMDIYSTGAVLYQMLTGEKPCEGSDRQGRYDELKKPSSFGISIDKNLERIILKAMAIRSDYRFQSAEAFQQALEGKSGKIQDPDGMQKQRDRKGAIRFALVSIILLMAIAGGVLYWTNDYTGKHVDLSAVQSTDLTVWLAGEETTDQSERITLIKDQFQEVLPQVTLDIREISKDEYWEKWEAAEKADDLPDVFCLDYIDEEEDQICSRLDNLKNTLDPEQYPMLQYRTIGAFYSLPTGFNVGLLYQNKEKYDQKQQETVDTIKLDKLKENLDGIAVYQDIEAMADPEKDTLAVLADLGSFDEIGDLTIRAVPAREIAIGLPCQISGRPITEFCDTYGVIKTKDKSIHNAGMYCIQLLLSEGVQEKTYMSGNNGIPLDKDAQKDYKENRLTGYLQCIGDHFDEMSVPDPDKSIDDYYRENLE